MSGIWATCSTVRNRSTVRYRRGIYPTCRFCTACSRVPSRSTKIYVRGEMTFHMPKRAITFWIRVAPLKMTQRSRPRDHFVPLLALENFQFDRRICVCVVFVNFNCLWLIVRLVKWERFSERYYNTLSERSIAKRTMICIAMRKKYDANMYNLPLPNNLKLDLLIQCHCKGYVLKAREYQ